MNVIEFMEEGIMTTIIGLGVVFSVLIILALFIKFLNSAVDSAENKKKLETSKLDQELASNNRNIASSMEAKNLEGNQEGVSAAVIAAITASICALTGKSATEFRFTEIKRVTNSQPMWAMVGTSDIISNRQRFNERGNR